MYLRLFWSQTQSPCVLRLLLAQPALARLLLRAVLHSARIIPTLAPPDVEEEALVAPAQWWAHDDTVAYLAPPEGEASGQSETVTEATRGRGVTVLELH